MNIQSNNTSTPAFTSRSWEVRQAEKVCRTVQREFPHMSTSKLMPIFSKYAKKNKTLFKYNVQPDKLDNFHYLLNSIELTFFRNSENQYVNPKTTPLKEIVPFCKDENGAKHLISIANKIYKLDNARNAFKAVYKQSSNNFYASADILKKTKLGNCMENAILGEAILKLNGIKNATFVHFDQRYITQQGKMYDTIDHAAVAFNTDGSAVNAKNISKTIIIDPWAGFADFAQNAFQRYKTFPALANEIQPNAQISIIPSPRVSFTKLEEKCIKKEFPNLMLKSDGKPFLYKIPKTKKVTY